MALRGLLVGLFFWAMCLSLSAQIVQSARVEFPIGYNEGNFEIMPVQQYGLFLYRSIITTEEDAIEIYKIDTAFHENWHGYLPIDKRSKLIGKRSQKDHLFFLLQKPEFTKHNFVLYSVSQDKGSFIRYDIKNYISFSVNEFQVTDSAAIIGGYFNHVPVVMHYSFRTGRSKVLPGLLNELGDLTQVKTYDDGTFDVLIAARNFNGQKTIWIKNYDAEGELLRNVALVPEGNKNLIFARSVKTNNNMQIVAGVFGGRNSEFSRGFFMASLDPSGVQQLRYYNFQDLENFFKYMRANRETRVKQRIERRKVKGKRTRFNYRFLVHELVPYGNQYILLGEAFYPKYNAYDRYNSGYSGFFTQMGTPAYQNQLRNGRVFDGYYYTHAVVMGFDHDGNVRWDNSFEINDVKTYTLEQFVKLEMQEDKIVLLYLYENQLRSKIIQGNQVLEGKTTETIHSSQNELVLKEVSSSNKLEHWYGNAFYASGIQEVVNPQLGKRRVFYINKIVCEK